MIDSRTHMPFDEIRQAAHVTASSLVKTKLSAYQEGRSSRHLDDVAGIIRVQGETFDLVELERVASRLGLLGEWRGLLKNNGAANSAELLRQTPAGWGRSTRWRWS